MIYMPGQFVDKFQCGKNEAHDFQKCWWELCHLPEPVEFIQNKITSLFFHG